MNAGSNERKIHLICNAHLDPVWLWEWEEGAAAAISTFRTAADLCEQFDTFIFNHNEVILYRWVEEYDPALFARIQSLVRQDRWHIIGGWYLQPDCNMPSGESFVRQILLGRRYFAEKFGARPTTAINFDSFGHSRGLVQILSRSGYNGYIFCRPDQANCALPNSPFIWEGFDGSRVLAVRPWGHYLSALGKARQKVEEYLRAQPADNPGILLWGVGDHGGGPSRIDLQSLAEIMADQDFRLICHSTPEDFFEDVRTLMIQQRQSLPIRSASLNAWGVGCYSTQSQVKHKHRLLENELYMAEKIAASAWVQGRMPYPQADLQEAMRDLATSEFHDILPGSSIQPVEEMAMRLSGHGLEILSRIKARAFFALAQGQPAARENEIPILVYNPHPYPVKAVIETEFQLADQNWGSDFTVAIVYQDGHPLPCQIEQELSSLNLDWRKRIAFQAELAPSQMNRFDCQLARVSARPVPSQPEGEAIHFQNETIEVTINKRTGLIDAYRVGGVDYLRPGSGRFLVLADSPDPWTFTKRSFDEVIGSFRLLSAKKSAWFAAVNTPGLAPVRVIEDGAFRTIIEALFGYRDSFLCLRYKLPKQGAEIEIEARVHWNEKDRLLKMSLPFISRKSRLLGQVAYGVEDLPVNGEESVAQKWAAVVSDDTALTVVNDRTYGLDFSTERTASDLRLTILRAAGYAAHPILERPLLPEDRYSPRQDQGERLFHFWLQGGPTAQRLTEIDREALAHNEKPLALAFFPGGEGQQPAPLAIVYDPAVQVTAIKKTETGDRLVFRLFEPTGQARSILLELPFAGISKEIRLSPFEIKTLCFDAHTKTWEETNLIEESLAQSDG